VLGGLASTGVLGDILGLFVDAEVRDAYQDHTSPTYQDAIVRDEADGKATVATLVALGVNPRQFAYLKRAALEKLTATQSQDAMMH
jgi:hypothetical protein